METEASRRAAAAGLTERILSRILAVGAAAIVVASVIASVFSTEASPAAKSLGVVVCIGSGVALVVFGCVGRGSLAVPVWSLGLISALCSLSFGARLGSSDSGSARVLRAGLLGFAIVVSAITSQYCLDRRFATPQAPGQARTSALTLLVQIGSAALGLVSVLTTFNGRGRMSYTWFFVGVASLFILLGVAARGLHRSQ